MLVEKEVSRNGGVVWYVRGRGWLCGMGGRGGVVW